MDEQEKADEQEKTAGPKSENCQVRGRITSPFSASVAGIDLPWGKWMQGPQGVPAGSAQLGFEAWGAKGTATGTEGTVTYQLPDGAKFALYFNDPYSAQNQCTITGVGGPFTQYNYKCEYPAHGSSWDVFYTITKK